MQIEEGEWADQSARLITQLGSCCPPIHDQTRARALAQNATVWCGKGGGGQGGVRTITKLGFLKGASPTRVSA